MSGQLPRVTAAEVLRALLRNGWYVDRQADSHAHLMHPDKPGRRVTVARLGGTVLKPKTLNSILAQAGLSREDFRRLR